jgi:hypothetical protein
MVMMPALEARGGITQRPGELLTQLQSGSKQSDFRVCLAEAESLGGFPDGKPFHVPQQKHEPVLLVQPGQRLVQQTLNLMLLD